MKKILFIGEILIDKIIDDTKTLYVLGGSTANIVINLSRLGFKTEFYGSVGNDEWGKYIINELMNYGVSGMNINVVKKPTTMVEINKTDDSPEASFERSSDYFIRYTNQLKKMVNKADIIHFSFWPLSKQPALNTILKVIKQAKKGNKLIGFDPNYHPKLISDESVTLSHLKEIIGMVDYIKPSLDDSKRIFGNDKSIEEYLELYYKLGAKNVIMTLGKGGVITKIDGVIKQYSTISTNVIDATGAGDAFWSGLYAGLIENESLERSIMYGQKCSHYSLLEVGAHAKLPTFDQLKSEI